MVSTNLANVNNVLLDAALAYASRGWRLIPLHHLRAGGQCSCGKPGCKPGKHPRLKDWPNRATTDEATIRNWWARWPGANVGLACGPGSDVIALDIEAEDGHQSHRRRRATPPLPLADRLRRRHQPGEGEQVAHRRQGVWRPDCAATKPQRQRLLLLGDQPG